MTYRLKVDMKSDRLDLVAMVKGRRHVQSKGKS